MSGIATTVLTMAMTAQTAFIPTISVTSLKTVRSTPLTLTSSAATVLLLTMTLTSKGC